jgi:dihydrodipicolinate synthase/N-acetylneuraminate lyase
MASNAEKRGATGLLLLPHYLTETSVEGICRHVEAVGAATSLGVIVYKRNVCKLNADALERLADKCPNLIGFKDGVGDIETWFQSAAASAIASLVSAACQLRKDGTFSGGPDPPGEF